MNIFLVVSTLVIVILTAVQAWYTIPEKDLKWFFDTMGIPLSIVLFLFLIIIAVGLIIYLVWLLRDKIVAKSGALIERIGSNKVPEFKCNFSKEVLFEALNEFFDSVQENLAKSEKSNQGKLLKIVWEDVNKLLELLNKCLVSYDKKDDYHKSQEVHNELTSRMLQLEQILEGTPEPDPFTEDSLQDWLAFLSITKGKMKKGEFELKGDRSEQ